MLEAVVVFPNGHRKIIHGYGMDTIRKELNEIRDFTYYSLKYRPLKKQTFTIMGIPV